MFLGRARWPGALASRGVTHRPPPGGAGHAPHRPARDLLDGPVERRCRSRGRGPRPLCQEPTRVHSERSKTLRSNAFQGGHSE
jgi:hypothetical protein